MEEKKEETIIDIDLIIEKLLNVRETKHNVVNLTINEIKGLCI